MIFKTSMGGTDSSWSWLAWRLASGLKNFELKTLSLTQGFKTWPSPRQLGLLDLDLAITDLGRAGLGQIQYQLYFSSSSSSKYLSFSPSLWLQISIFTHTLSKPQTLFLLPCLLKTPSTQEKGGASLLGEEALEGLKKCMLCFTYKPKVPLSHFLSFSIVRKVGERDLFACLFIQFSGFSYLPTRFVLPLGSLGS